MLFQSDISAGPRGRNGFYCLQLLEHDRLPQWYVYRRWGRGTAFLLRLLFSLSFFLFFFLGWRALTERGGGVVGTSGSNTCHEYEDRADAIEQFKERYYEKSGNNWDERHAFEKVRARPHATAQRPRPLTVRLL